MNMISSFSLYSRRHEIVPGRPETVGGEDVTEIGEAAVERGPAAETLSGQRGDGTIASAAQKRRSSAGSRARAACRAR